MVFEYLTVLISVIVGLSVTSFLTNVVRIIHVRGEVTISWAQLLWSVVILMWTIAFWWFTFVLAAEREWTYPLFVFLLAYSTLLFVLMALLFPEGVPENHNYRTQFMRNRIWFFSTFLLFLCVDLTDYVIKLEKDVSIVGHLPYVAFVGPLIVLSLFALRTDNLIFHRVFAVYSVLAMLAMSVTTLVPLAS
jgi:phosphoglycerol transferase MdoB-like AlkP superfamily enzyme